MNPYIVVAFIVLATVLGDYFLKLSAASSASFGTIQFWIGAGLYSLTAAGWVLAMKHLTLAAVGVYYSVLTILLLTFLGVFVFGEAITVREVAGVGLALASIVLMTRFA